MTRRRLGYLIAILILVGSIGIARLMIASRPEPARKELPSQIPLVITEPAAAGAGAIPVYGAGTVQPRAEIDVKTEVSGRVVWVNPAFQSGGRLQKGQLFFRLDDSDYRYQVQRAAADVAVQETELLEVEEEARIARAQQIRFQNRRQKDESPTPDIGPLALWEPQIAAARAVLEQRRVSLAEAELQLSRTEVRAPFDGIVRAETVGLGQFVTAGDVLGQFFAADAVDVVVPLSDRDVTLLPGLWALKAGEDEQRIPVRIMAEYGEERYDWPGYVDRARADLDAETRTVNVIVRVLNPFPDQLAEDTQTQDAALPLLVGKFVEAQIEGVTPDAYFRIRSSALRADNMVWALRDDGRLTIIPVQVLQRIDDDVFVTGPLKTGQQVIIGGIQVATEGMVVQTVSKDSP